MSAKDIVDTVLRLLGILISWPVILLCVIIMVRREFPELVSNLAQRMTKAPGGFEFAALQQKVDSIATTVKQIEEQLQFRPSAALTPDLQKKMESAFSSFRGYLQQLGLTLGEGRIEVAIQPNYENAHYDGIQKLIVIGESLAGDTDVAFREYMHHALMSLAKETHDNWSRSYDEIESGLADYFPCSFNNDPLVGEIFARRKYGKAYIRNLNNRRKFTEASASQPFTGPQDIGEIWGGAFWDMRTQLGKSAADKLLFSTWGDLLPTDTRSDEPTRFVRKLVQHAQSSQGEPAAEQIRSIFKSRGLEI